MRLTELTCQGFRGLAPIAFQPAPGLNVIRGANAQGKTSLLEAVLFAATSKSHRTNLETDLAAHGGEGFAILLHAQRADRSLALETRWHRGAKRIKVNGVAQTRVSDLLGRLNVILFSPEDVGLVKGGAAGRRRFLDMALAQTDPAYLAALQRYRHVLRQRNELLRRGQHSDALLEPWERQLAEEGAALIVARGRFLEALAGAARDAYAHIAGAEPLDLVYAPDVDAPDALADVLTRGRGSDRKRGMTQHGPHRDDFDFLIDGKPARNYASQGQQKTAALALKLAEARLAQAHTGEWPVLMLDEVLSELDQTRAARLFNALPAALQCLLTATHLTGRAGPEPPDAASFLIQNGQITQDQA